jgi:hypothetical protein
MLLIQYSTLFRGKLKVHSCRDVWQNRLGVVYCLYDVAELGLVCSFRVLICKPKEKREITKRVIKYKTLKTIHY